MVNYIQHKESDYNHKQLVKQIEKNNRDYIDEIIKRNESQRILIHDIKKHLNTIQIMAQNKDAERIDKYITELYESPALHPPIRYCPNDLINSIIYKYAKEAQKYGITLTVDSGSAGFSFVDDYDLTVIICNLLDNSIESAKDTSDSFITITLTEDSNNHVSIISVTNSCNKTVQFAKGIPISNKPDRYYHGLGIRSVLNVLKKYDGTYNMYQDDRNDFNTIILLRNGSRI